MPADDNKYSKMLLERKHLLNDVGGINYCSSTEAGEGFSRSVEYFCDNIIVWTLCHNHSKVDSNRSFAVTNDSAIGIVRNIIKEFINKPNLKYIGRGIDHEPDSVRRKIHRKREATLEMGQGRNPDYVPGYIATKITLSAMSLNEVHSFLELAEEKLRTNFIVLHDIDIANDCAGITTRALVQKYLVRSGVSVQSIVPDRYKVGDDCISWMDDEGRRCKIYNKFVQMLQSCDVRKPLGSLIADLVHNHDANFTDKLLEYREDGMTRVEMTIYSSKIRSVKWYEDQIDGLFDFLDECPVHLVSFDDQWEKITRRLTSVTAMHITNKYASSGKESIFVYSHWWNSITQKIQGYARKGIEENDVKNVLANFSFNNRPTYLITGKLDRKGILGSIKESTWMREDGCDKITLVPGSGRSLYPSYSGLQGKTVKFEEVGLGTSNGITLGWPQRRIDKRSKALAKISKIKRGISIENETDGDDEDDDNDDDDDDESENGDNTLEEINISQAGRFTSAHSFAKENPSRTLTIVAYGRRMYYGKLTTHVVAKDGTRLIATKSLQEIVDEEIVHGIHFDVRIFRPVVINGYRDVECTLL
jgi:hypothetical protein